jgi:hypothetical protein
VLLDRYPYRCEIKGGYRKIKSKNIIITTNIKPEDLYALPGEDIKQLLRRIDHIKYFDCLSTVSKSQFG